MAYERAKKFFLENKWSLLVLLMSTAFFLVQHKLDLVWDFGAYFMNAEYLFGAGDIYEVYRAPLMVFIMGIFLFLGNFAEYIYIIFASIIFFIGNFKLSGVLHEKYFYRFKFGKWFTRFLFYSLSLNVFVLYYGLRDGTELLGLAFLELFLALLISGNVSGYLLGLAFLSRYNFLYFLPLLFLNKSLKTILYNIGTFVLVILPWYIFNLVEWGNGLTSIVDSYNLNVFSRRSIEQTVEISSFLEVFNWLLPLFLIGLFVLFYYVWKERDKDSLKYGLLFIIVGLITVFDFLNTPFKITRYLFNLTLPITFFSLVGLSFIINKFKQRFDWSKFKKYLVLVFVGILLISSIFLVFYAYKYSNDSLYENAANDIKNSDLSGCTFRSSRWVPINYNYPSSQVLSLDFEKYLERDYPVILFRDNRGLYEGNSIEDFEEYRIVIEKPTYVILSSPGLDSEDCVEWKGYSSPTIGNTCKFVSERSEEKFGMKNFSYRVCSFLNPFSN